MGLVITGCWSDDLSGLLYDSMKLSLPFSPADKQRALESTWSICVANGCMLVLSAAVPWGSLAKGSVFWCKTVPCEGISQYMHTRAPWIRTD